MLILHPHDEALLARVLDGFDRQTAPATLVERIVFDPARGASIGAARNAALARARAPLVLWFDGRQLPLPGLVEYCLDVHRTHRQVEESLLVCVTGDAGLRRHPLYYWMRQTDRVPGRPSASGVYAWPYFRVHALACKRAIFTDAAFDERFRAGEDTQLAARLVRSVPLKVLYEQLPQAAWVAPPVLDASLEAEYLDGYFRGIRTAEDPRSRTISDVDDRFAFAERHVRPLAELTTLVASLGQLEASLIDVEPELALGETADRLQIVYQMYEALFAHAAACGWLDAERGRPARPETIWRPAARAAAPRRAAAHPSARRPVRRRAR